MIIKGGGTTHQKAVAAVLPDVNTLMIKIENLQKSKSNEQKIMQKRRKHMKRPLKVTDVFIRALRINVPHQLGMTEA